MLKLRLTGVKEEVERALRDLPDLFRVMQQGKISPLSDSEYYRVFVEVELLSSGS